MMNLGWSKKDLDLQEERDRKYREGKHSGQSNHHQDHNTYHHQHRLGHNKRRLNIWR